jgi:Flp pilus assembly pilin Flp
MLWQDKSTRGCPQKFIRQREVKGMRELRRLTREFLQEEDAVGVVEIILILVVLIGLVMIFKDQLTSLVKNILSKITKQSNSI